MSDPRHYSISILENFSDKPLQEIALVVAKKIEKEISEDNFTLWDDAVNLEVGTNFLTTEQSYTWYFAADELLPILKDFPDTCFCLSVSDGECGGQHRVLFFNGKWVKQYPEILYEEFRPNDFEYQASKKKSLLEQQFAEVETERLIKIAGMADDVSPDSPPKQGNFAETIRKITNPQINTDNLKKVIAEMDERIERVFGSRQDA